MIIDNVPEQMSEDDVIELANEFTEYLLIITSTQT